MAYFLSQFAGIQSHQLPQLTVALAVAFAAAAVTRLCVVPTTSRGILRRLAAAFDRALLDAQVATSTFRADDRSTLRRLKRRLDRLHVCALLLQDFVREAPAGLLGDTTVEAERTAGAEAAAQHLGALAIRASGIAPMTCVCVVAGPAPRIRAKRVSSRPATRQALQVTVAATLAMIGGHLISAELWYWAVVTTWVVFINAEHTGDIVLQGGRRLVGTVAGVIFGYGFAVLAVLHILAALAILLACIFGIFYTSARRYWAVTFFITGSLSMVLSLLGAISADVLVVRVQETVLGAVCGIVAAALVVPTSVRRVADARLTDLLTVIDRPAPDGRDLDRALEAYRKACGPLVHPLNPHRAERARVGCAFERLEALAYHARRPSAQAGRSTPEGS